VAADPARDRAYCRRIGIDLLGFTVYLVTAGFARIALAVRLTTNGLLLTVPAKIYTILRFTRSARAGTTSERR
jgi:hypothetical protein